MGQSQQIGPQREAGLAAQPVDLLAEFAGDFPSPSGPLDREHGRDHFPDKRPTQRAGTVDQSGIQQQRETAFLVRLDQQMFNRGTID